MIRAPNTVNATGIVCSVSDAWLQQANPPAKYDIREHVKNFETAAQVQERCNDWRKVLSAGDNCHQRLGKAMGACYDDEPCGLSFEPQCGRTWRINYVWRAAEAIEQHYAGAPLTMVTLVDVADQFAVGDLHTLSVTQHENRLKARLINAGLGHVAAIGAIDFVNNKHIADAWEEHWQVHDHIILIGLDGAQVKAAMKDYYPKILTIPTPIKTKPVYDLLGALSYTYKCTFFRRLSIIDGRGHKNTLPPQMIPDPQLQELAAFLSTISFADRLFLRGFRRRGAVLAPNLVGE